MQEEAWEKKVEQVLSKIIILIFDVTKLLHQLLPTKRNCTTIFFFANCTNLKVRKKFHVSENYPTPHYPPPQKKKKIQRYISNL